MPSARNLQHVAVLIVLFLWLPPSTPVAAAAELVLDPAWYSVARPYRYVEARRFEGGWNRGADVVVSDSSVRSPVTGTVRFAGLVAGRRVVTLATRIEGEPVVVTLTGLRAIEVDEGQEIRAGTVVGRGTALHVGAYDRSRRSRYLPVRAGGMSAAAGVMPSRGGSAVPVRPSLSGSIAARLRAAILGEVGPHDPRPGGRARGSAPAGRTDVTRAWPWPYRDGGVGRTNAIVLPLAGSRMTFGHGRADGAGPALARSPALARGLALARGAGATNATSLPPASGQVAFDDDRAAGVPLARARDAARPATGADSGGRPPGSAGGTAVDGMTAGRSTSGDAVAPRISGGPPGPAAGGRAGSRLSPHPGLAGAEAGVARPSVAISASAAEQPLQPSPPEPIAASGSARSVAAAGAAIGLLSILFAWRRRRRRPEPREPRAMHQPMPVMLPQVRPHAYPVVRSGGSSVLSDIALAWSDRDPGTSPVTDPSPRASTRAPEHA